jgi:predicted ester cyclase
MPITWRGWNGVDMSATPAEVAKRWFGEVWNERKASTIAELLHPAVVGHTATGETTGPEGWKRLVWDQLTGAFSNIRVSIEDMVAVDETVVTRWRATMVHTGDALGIPPSERSVEVTGMTWMTVRGGRIVEGWDGWDSTGLLVQCGGATLHPALRK